MSQETKIEEWEKEFDEKFQDPMEKKYGKGFALYCSYCDGTWRNEIKSFIRSLLTSHDAKWQQHEHDMYESLEKAHREEFAELARKIEGMGDVLSQEQTPWDNGYDAGYNQARKDVLALLNNK